MAARIGVVVGKFNPPHLGHRHLIEVAAATVEHVHVLLCDRPDQTIGADARRRWLVDAVPSNVTVHVTPDDLPAENGPWARRALEVLPQPPDVAFTSERWGPGWATLMGAEHHLVDLERGQHPISATVLRRDLAHHFHWLVPAARADLARRVVCVGAESTGKSTMAEALARELATVWVPEYGRSYWEGRRHLADQGWSTEEFRRIADGQRRMDADLARSACAGVVAGDTDALVTSVWHERYLGRVDPVLEAMLLRTRPDLYLVCGAEFEWVQDGTRESLEHRDSMQAGIMRRVEASGVPWVLLEGSPVERLRIAQAAVAHHVRFDPLV